MIRTNPPAFAGEPAPPLVAVAAEPAAGEAGPTLDWMGALSAAKAALERGAFAEAGHVLAPLADRADAPAAAGSGSPESVGA